jgi:hypothetical protein
MGSRFARMVEMLLFEALTNRYSMTQFDARRLSLPNDPYGTMSAPIVPHLAARRLGCGIDVGLRRQHSPVAAHLLARCTIRANQVAKDRLHRTPAARARRHLPESQMRPRNLHTSRYAPSSAV